MATRIFQKPPKDHPIYAVIGRVAAEWAELEHRLDWIIWSLSQTTPELASCITGQIIGHSPRFNAIIALLMQRRLIQRSISPDLIKSAIRERDKVSALAELRNRLVHDTWYVDTATGEAHQFRSMPRRELTFGIKPQTPAELGKLIKQIEQRIEAVNKLGETIFAELFPSQGTPP